jgi:hypothetical protein
MPKENPGRAGAVRAGVLMISWIVVVSAADYAVGAHVSLASLYAVGVALAAWRWGQLAALGAAVLCAAVAGLSDSYAAVDVFGVPTGCDQSRTVVWWNSLVRLFAFLLIASTVSTFRTAMRERDSAVQRLELAFSEIRTLEGLLPICAWCKRIRDEQREGEWVSVEKYVSDRTAAEFTHGICPQCEQQLRRS